MKKTAPTKAPTKSPAAARPRATLPAGALPPIERGIPIPPRVSAQKGPRTALGRHLERLDVNETFAVPSDLQKTLAAAAGGARKRTGRRFTIRRIDDMARVWRIK